MKKAYLRTKKRLKRWNRTVVRFTRESKSLEFVFPKIDSDSMAYVYFKASRYLRAMPTATSDDIRARRHRTEDDRQAMMVNLSDPESVTALKEVDPNNLLFQEEGWGLESVPFEYKKGVPWPRVRGNWRRTWR